MATQCETYAAQLLEAQAALHALLTGTKTVSVSYADKTVTYNQINQDGLRAYIQDLQNKVDACNGTRTGRRIFHIIPG